MTSTILTLADPGADLELAGGKGASLAKLLSAGLPVPDGFHITTDAYRRFVAANELQPEIEHVIVTLNRFKPAELEAAARRIGDLFSAASFPLDLRNEILAAYRALSGQQPAAVAVRSSATVEDLPEASFAGQQETYLNVRGEAQLLEAVRKCWASLWTVRAIAYRARQNIRAHNVSLAVVVQLMVPAEAAGILFTVNPLNARRDEIVINAAWGLGEAVVGGAVTPDTVTVSKTTRKVIRRETAEKQVMTVQGESGTHESPVPESKRNQPVLSDEQVATLAGIAMRIEELFGLPVDVEWAFSGGEFAILQARPVTALPEPPVEWPRPDPKGVYMRGSVVDLMPNPLSPLFSTFGIGALRKQMDPLSLKITRSRAFLGDEYFSTINQYAYMNAHLPPKAMWWTFTRLLPSYPRLFRMMIPLWRDETYPEYKAFVAGLRDINPSALSEVQLWKQAQAVMDQIALYVDTLLFATMGASAGSEMLLTRVYNRFAKREGDPDATVLVMGWDNIPIRAEKSLFDLAIWARHHEELAHFLLETPAAELARRVPPLPIFSGEDVRIEGFGVSGWDEFVVRFHAHLSKFGHTVYQLDIAEPLPMEDPTAMFETVKMYLRGEGVNPYERQQVSEQRRIQTAESVLARLKGFKRWAFRNALKWGQSMASIREDALAEIGLGYPYLRRLLGELGNRFVHAGIIEQAEDIFMLHQEEVDALIRGERMILKDQVAERRAFLARMQKQIAPPMIPIKERVWGVKVDMFVAQGGEIGADNVLKGVPASVGKVTAPACVLLGPEDFYQMRPGDVLVAGATTPAWTPLFAMASAVVTDIGGPLSHGSIVAREYGIPAVMGTGVATKRIRTGQLITVDGSAGLVTLF
jgi:pyruvate,water dikinase